LLIAISLFSLLLLAQAMFGFMQVQEGSSIK